MAIVDADEANLLLAVGDWFVAESWAPRPVKGVTGTAFTSHAPTVRRRVAEFDDTLASILAAQGVSLRDSRRVAIGRIREKASTLPKHPAWSCD